MITFFSADPLSGEQIFSSVKFIRRGKSKNNKKASVELCLAGNAVLIAHSWLLLMYVYLVMPQHL